MDINYLGHSSFKLKGKEGVVVTDPFNAEAVGLDWNKIKADVVTISHQHDDHNYVDGVKVSSQREKQGVFVIHGPGEYEASDIMVQGWSTWHDNQQGAERGPNVIYMVELDKIRILHLGDLGHEINQELKEDIGQVDVLMVPVGGKYTIDAKTAVKVAKSLSPSYVIPMHYNREGLKQDVFEGVSGVDEFLQEMGVDSNREPVEKLSVSPSTLPEDTTAVVMKS